MCLSYCIIVRVVKQQESLLCCRYAEC